MQITTWNVNGIRAIFRKKADKWWWDEAPDVLCLQEVRATPEQLPKKQRQRLEELHHFWNPAQRAGYSGVATFSIPKPIAIKKGFGVERFDVEGRVIQTQYPDFRLFNIYFPNGQRGQERLAYKLDFYAHLLELCDQLHAAGERVIICGDFNTAHNEIDLKNPKQNETNSGFLPEERAWIDKYLEHGFCEIYRHLYPEKEEYSWWTYRHHARERNIGWRLDYFLISDALIPRVQDVVIHTDALGSDHCPVSLFLK
ncbi:MAG: exodeoxyribonuclease III [Chloroflexota bacterium]|nr:MAG: exodeoxyribonuclease III [Chloroflexota bacterium]